MFAMKVVGLVIGIVLLLSVYRSARVPSDAQVKGLDHRLGHSQFFIMLLKLLKPST